MIIMTKEERKDVRKNLGRVHRFVLIYTFIFTLVTFASMIVATVVKMDGNLDIELSQLQNLLMQQSGLHSLVALAAGVLFILLNRRSRLADDLHTGATQRMSVQIFASCFVLLFTFQLLSAGAEPIVRWIAEQFGYGIDSTIDGLDEMKPTLSMFLYASFLGPVIEEVVFRGVAMKGLRKYGKLFAIVTTAALFAIFHGDLLQGIFAFFCGLLLGYVAMEYGFGWAVALHVVNNFILADVLTRAFSLLPANVQEPAQMVLFVVLGGFGGLYVLVKNRRRIAGYIADNRTEKGIVPVLWTVPSFWLFLLMELATVSMSFTKMG